MPKGADLDELLHDDASADISQSQAATLAASLTKAVVSIAAAKVASGKFDIESPRNFVYDTYSEMLTLVQRRHDLSTKRPG